MNSARNLSVFIPTRNRPQFLRTALRSVQEQTAVGRVREVVVVENGGARDSETVCREFSALPIHYIFRDPPIAPEHSGPANAATVSGEFVAVLCDDDWWTNYHLESACSMLDSQPEAAAYFCNALFTSAEENACIDHLYHAWLPWFAAKGKCRNGLHVLSRTDMLVASLVATPFHLSGMVINRSAWTNCLRAHNHGNPFDTDRLLQVEVTRYGSILFQSHPGVYVRMHPNQEVRRLSKSGEAQKWFNDTTRRILEFALGAGVNLKKEFADRLAATGNDLTRLCAASTLGSVRFLEMQGVLPALGAQDTELRYQEAISRLNEQEASHRKTVEAIMQSRTFRVGRVFSKYRPRLQKILPSRNSP